MPSLKIELRKFLWKILGVDYNQILKTVDNVYLKNDLFSTIGIGTYDNNATVYRWSDAPLIIGNYCSIANGVKFIIDDGRHQIGKVTSYPFASNVIGTKRGITIGNDVWIGMNTIILNGVTIGNGVTVAAGSVVTADIPDYCVAAGVPAKVVKKKCTDIEAKQMNEIAWWNWEENKIDDCMAHFKLDIPEFISKHSKHI